MTPPRLKSKTGPATLAALVTALGALASLDTLPAAAQNIVNIDATLYGFNSPTDPAPVPGQLIAPFSLAPGGLLDQLTLGPGTYTLTNATGLPGADPNFNAYRYNGGNNWFWAVVVADDATDKVVFYGDAGTGGSSAAAVAAQPAVQNFSGTFTLPTTTRLDFMARDYYLPDNAGGMAVLIRPLAAPAVPEAGGFALAGLGLLPLLGLAARRRRMAPPPQ